MDLCDKTLYSTSQDPFAYLHIHLSFINKNMIGQDHMSYLQFDEQRFF